MMIKPALAMIAASLLAGCGESPSNPIPPLPGCSEEDCGRVVESVVTDAMAEQDLKAVLIRVTLEGEELVTLALGEAQPGVAVTPEHRFRNGAVAISYLSTLLLRLADRGETELDATLDTWFPELPNAESVTLRMLANSTTGYPDYVPNESFISAFYSDPFHTFTASELLGFAFETPPWYEPGTDWNYAHTNFLVLGMALEEIGQQPLEEMLLTEVLIPLGLSGTRPHPAAQMEEPVLHHYTSERGSFEDATFWTPSWQLPAGALMTTTIHDLATSARGIGRGELLSEGSYAELLSTAAVEVSGSSGSCPSEICPPLSESRYFGSGVLVSGSWIMQTPTFLGFSGVQAYDPDLDLAVAVAVSGVEGPNQAVGILLQVVEALAPGQGPPL